MPTTIKDMYEKHEDRLTGLALMHVHKDKDEEVINNFVREHPRRMKLDCILKD